MFNHQPLPLPHVINYPVELPINVLLALPDYVGEEHEPPPFNLLGVINHLMGSAGWEQAMKVVRPHVWAPEWDDERLQKFFDAPFGEKGRAVPGMDYEEMRVKDFPGSRGDVDIFSWSEPHFEIIHFIGAVPSWFYFEESHLQLSGEEGRYGSNVIVSGRAMSAGKLRDALVMSHTRLLILEVNKRFEESAIKLARYVGGGGGPAVLVVAGGDATTLDAYFTDLYAAIIHNRPLAEAARPNFEKDLNVTLYSGEGGEDLLKFDRFLNGVRSRLVNLRGWVDEWESEVKNFLAERKGLLHRSQLRKLESRSYVKPDLGQDVPTLEQLEALDSNINFAHESGGVVPLAEIADALPRIEDAYGQLRGFLGLGGGDTYWQLREQLDADVEEMAREAPRVLNSNFADPRTGLVLEPRQTLVAGREYDLMVDVGPRWNKVLSIVTGNSEFPESSLPPDDEGYLIKVVLFSDDFTSTETATTIDAVEGDATAGTDETTPGGDQSRVVDIEPPPQEVAMSDGEEASEAGRFRACLLTRWMWVPRHTGRSFPVVEGKPLEKAGPILLRVLAPELPEGSGERFITARGRLCLYYRNNLLQSAVVEVGVGRTPDDTQRDVPNRIFVDYVLTGTFQDLGQYETRTLRSESGEQSSYGVGLNLTLNGDGGDGHRIILEEHEELTVWRPYDPTASTAILNKARETLKECFWPRDDRTCRVDTLKIKSTDGLGADNDKRLRQFKCDLYWLACLGFELHTKAFAQLNINDWPRWSARFDQALATRTVIQVARTGLAQYVYPWALLYDIPLPDRNVSGGLRWCKVLDEWSAPDGRRKGPAAEACPYRDAPEHRKNTLCPYGFWGLKHYIEQPINVLPVTEQEDGDGKLTRNVLREIKVGRMLELSVGITRDAGLDFAKINAHLAGIKKLSDFTPVNGADDWQKVQAMLVAPEVAYFLCHGEFDAGRGEPYIGIGPRDNDLQHRVYPTELTGWARTVGASLWQDRRPLIFINGCHTGDLRPGEILNFVKTFADFGASGVIGTEVSIRLPLAIEVAERLLKKVLGSASVGRAMHEVRWELANKGNLLGLAYTPYCLSELHISRDGENP